MLWNFQPIYSVDFVYSIGHVDMKIPKITDIIFVGKQNALSHLVSQVIGGDIQALHNVIQAHCRKENVLRSLRSRYWSLEIFSLGIHLIYWKQ